MDHHKDILIVGIGNTLRSDDGIGAYVCSSISKMHIPHVNTIIVQQLDTALIDEFVKNDVVILVDAAVSGKAVSFYATGKNNSSYIPASHNMSAEMLAALTHLLYKKDLQIMICAVKADNFALGETLSATARRHADDAVNSIVNWIKNGCS